MHSECRDCFWQRLHIYVRYVLADAAAVQVRKIWHDVTFIPKKNILISKLLSSNSVCVLSLFQFLRSWSRYEYNEKSAKGTQNLRMHIVTEGKIASDLTFKRSTTYYTPHDIIRA